MRLLTTLVLFACALPALSGCCGHRHHCLFDRDDDDCVGDHDWDDDDWEDCCSPCGSPCGCAPAFNDYGAPWTGDCGCSAPVQPHHSFPAPMTYPTPSGCDCDATVSPTYQQPTYMTPTPETTPATTSPAPAANTESYYAPRPSAPPPPVPPVSFVPTRF
jgi:hypothetical protein